MKNLGISILMLGFLTAFFLGMDILSGFDLTTSINNAVNPFLVMEVAEIVIFFLLLIFLIAGPVLAFFRKKKTKQQKTK
ncbi:hypothetical protein [Domibacillus tundrae]|uniref:hypothetical protein n=1 Tax=Domibacillus tundrae TaxID=1587527 RepID=UPI0033997B56